MIVGPDGEVEVVELALPPRPEVVSVARLVVGALAAADPSFDDERGADLRLAVSEACTNAIQAQLGSASGSAHDAPIRLRFEVGPGCIELAVTDHGGGFDPDRLESHPAVMQAAIVPMPDPVLGEKACCFVTLKPGAQAPALEELCAWLAERKIAKIKLPERLVVIDEMPLTPTRKVIKGRLRIPS